MIRQYNAVIIGMGRMGKTRYDSMMKHGGYHISAVCDSNDKLLGDYTCKTYSDWKKCIDEEKPDIVVVCTYNSVIPDIVCYALEQGCHVFSEKPPGRNLSDTLRMKDAYEKNHRLVLKFGFNHRYHNSVIEAKALIESGFLGEVVAARGVYGKAGNLDRDEWRNRTDISGGGILLDQGIHMLDLLRYIVGDFSSISGRVDNLVWKESMAEDTAFATLRTEDGKIATLHSSAIQWKHKFDLDIVLSNGYIALNGLITSTNSYGEERITYYKRDSDFEGNNPGNPTEYTLCFDEDNSWGLEMEEFYNAIHSRRPIKNGTIGDAEAVMRLIDAVYITEIGKKQ